jgi:hypothetical protein
MDLPHIFTYVKPGRNTRLGESKLQEEKRREEKKRKTVATQRSPSLCNLQYKISNRDPDRLPADSFRRLKACVRKGGVKAFSAVGLKTTNQCVISFLDYLQVPMAWCCIGEARLASPE